MYITQSRLKECLSYDPCTGIFTWREARKGLRIGDVAGCKMTIGYITICIDRTAYGAHRLAWLYFNNEIPEIIDHIDGDKTNNRISNLRPATKSMNALNNAGARSDSVTGIHGVSMDTKRNKFVAKLVVNKKTVLHKQFIDIADAEAAYKAAKQKYCPDICATHKNFQYQ